MTHQKVYQKGFRQLVAWQKAHQRTIDIYRITASFPSEKRMDLRINSKGLQVQRQLRLLKVLAWLQINTDFHCTFGRMPQTLKLIHFAISF